MQGPLRSEGFRRNARWLVPALLLTWWTSPALAAAQLPVSRPVVVVEAPAATETGAGAPADTAPARSYAEREARAQLEQWSGGDYGGGVYISGTVLVIALLVALFLLILR
jgi:hypothetical protein